VDAVVASRVDVEQPLAPDRFVDSERLNAGIEQSLVDAVSEVASKKDEEAPGSDSGPGTSNDALSRPTLSNDGSWVLGLEGLEGGHTYAVETGTGRTFSVDTRRDRELLATWQAGQERLSSPAALKPLQPVGPAKPPAGSGAAVATATRRLSQQSIQGMLKKQELENQKLEVVLHDRLHTPAEGTKLPKVASLPVLPMDRERAVLESKRIVALTCHRMVAPPPAYHAYKQKSAMDLDLQGEVPKLHSDPDEQEKRFRRQRATYQGLPVDLAKNRKEEKVSLRNGATKKAKPSERSRSSPMLTSTATAMGSLGSPSVSEKRSAKLKPLPKGADMLKMLAEGALPSILCPPV